MNKMLKSRGTIASTQRLHLRATTIRVLKSTDLAAVAGGRGRFGGEGEEDPPTSYNEQNQCQTVVP